MSTPIFTPRVVSGLAITATIAAERASWMPPAKMAWQSAPFTEPPSIRATMRSIMDCQSTKLEREATTNAVGLYRFDAVDLGDYDLKVTMTGFAATTITNVTVTDRNGRFVTGLEKENFKLSEDKVPQDIAYFSSEDIPLSVTPWHGTEDPL